MTQTRESLVFKPSSIVEPIDLETVFPESRPLEVELGAGDGSFLVKYSQLHPEMNFFATERLNGRLRKIDRKGRRLGLRNLKVIRFESEYFLRYLMPPRSAVGIHLYFPDPWPKRKHRQFRIVNESFPELTTRVLVSGGRVYLRTDDTDYFGQMQEVFGRCDRFSEVPTPVELKGVVTDFEADFHARGIPTLRVAYELKG